MSAKFLVELPKRYLLLWARTDDQIIIEGCRYERYVWRGVDILFPEEFRDANPDVEFSCEDSVVLKMTLEVFDEDGKYRYVFKEPDLMEVIPRADFRVADDGTIESVPHDSSYT